MEGGWGRRPGRGWRRGRIDAVGDNDEKADEEDGPDFTPHSSKLKFPKTRLQFARPKALSALPIDSVLSREMTNAKTRFEIVAALTQVSDYFKSPQFVNLGYPPPLRKKDHNL